MSQSVKRINFIMALHNHQPEGNFPAVFANNYQVAYEPFICEVEQFPKIKVVQHYSGILLHWIEQNRPDFMARLRKLSASGQLELMGGAFYEPILAMIPDDDKVGQIEKQTRFLQENFQVEVTGAWLAERVWEPHLARPLAEAGIRYTVLDDAHFQNVGFTEEETLQYYLTEEAGERLFIFPISEKMRYLIPFADPQETIDYLAQMATPAGERVVVLADDGEKFGSWPGTADLVYKEQWLRRFFTLLGDNSDWINITTFQEYYSHHQPAGRVYLPTGSYREMMEWSGGYWRNFFVLYPESNQIHKKMLHVRAKLEQLEDGPQKKEAKEYVWAGQCNCAYWHGVFGGLYLNFLRSALYCRLLAAEGIIDRVLHDKEPWLELEQKDFDYDGAEEVVVTGPELGFVLAPAQGGSLLELDFKPRSFNLLDVLTRREEPYHCNIYEQAQGVCATDEVKTIHHITRVKEAGLEHLLFYDAYRRTSLLDHFYPREVELAKLSEAEAGDFVSGRYQLLSAVADESAQVELVRTGEVCLGEGLWPVSIKKIVTYQPQSGKLHYQYRLTNEGSETLEACFAVEFNINFLAGHAPDRYYSVPGHTLNDRHLDSRGSMTNVTHFGLVDEYLGISSMFRFARPTTVWRMPIETVSQSEEGMERVYQGSTILPKWDVTLLPHTPWTVAFTQSVEELVREVH
ncbi:MAG: DUF1926 domain-containing protein [Firmicutes bacterium]|nr:DUF1926 domain-containing protein [Bacillota bacterium]